MFEILRIAVLGVGVLCFFLVGIVLFVWAFPDIVEEWDRGNARGASGRVLLVALAAASGGVAVFLVHSILGLFWIRVISFVLWGVAVLMAFVAAWVYFQKPIANAPRAYSRLPIDE
jgi:hypothetical protein